MKKRLIFIIGAFSASFASMVILSLYLAGRFTAFSNYVAEADHTSKTIINIRSAEVYITDIGLNERGFIITRDSVYLRDLNAAIDSLYKLTAEIKVMISDNQRQVNNLTLLKAAISMRIAEARASVEYANVTKAANPSDHYFEARKLMNECTDRLGAMLREENSKLDARASEAEHYRVLTDRVMKTLFGVFSAITLILFIVMIREFIVRMKYQEELQARVIDLKRSHSELEEIAYVTSHDLQEPLRKIQVFSNMLQGKKKSSDASSTEILDRINTAANRVQYLIMDLMSLTSLTSTSEPRTHVDLNSVAVSVMADLGNIIREKDARLEIKSLPVINGYKEQLKILFRSLLDNSLKFTRPGITPVVTISCDTATSAELNEINPAIAQKKFYKISCSDNGIGFDNAYVTKIFRIFQRLHNQESGYDGKGIGLAICQRIMSNHEGYIAATGEPGKGAIFSLYFPAEG